MLRHHTKKFIENRWISGGIIALILINAIILGLETYPALMAAYGPWLVAIDRAILWVFVAEILLKIHAYGLRFFKEPWNWFDVAIVGISLVPAQEAFSVLRALRVLRVLRLISAVPRLRKVVQGLIGAIPGIGAIAIILVLIFYVFAVMAVKLFGTEFPEWFGTLEASLFTLFQIMTLEGWADIVRKIMEIYPLAWVFFFLYIIASTFTVLNLFIAVIVDAMQKEHAEEDASNEAALRAELAEIRKLLENLKR